MQISKVVVDDINEIVKEEKQLLTSSLGYSFILNDLNNPYALYYKISDLELIGYVGVRINDSQAEMLNFLIKKKYQSLGYGTKLLKYTLNELIEQNIKSLILEVSEDNDKAIRLYEKLGFKKILVKKKYYKDKDALVYLWENEK